MMLAFETEQTASIITGVPRVTMAGIFVHESLL